MSLAIFGISNGALNLVVSLLVLGFVVVWLALIVYTYLDAKRRISDPFLVGCATIASFFPYIGTIVYAIVRPPEFLEDAHERELETKAAELRVRQLTERSCPSCEHPIERDYLRCPGCQRRLKDPCVRCGKPVDPRWSLCPYCETPQPGRRAPRRTRPKAEARPAPRRKAPTAPAADPDRPEPRRELPARAGARAAPKPKRQQRSPAREPDPDPRKA